ncbi:MAG: hypothetical protein HC880_22460 [Bacteroidia bacterium]|nr:hypothetical protein [Bacteroidia bacterium]
MQNKDYPQFPYKVTTEAIDPYPTTIQAHIQKYHEALHYDQPIKPAMIRDLEDLIKKYPDLPTLKNHLQMIYKKTGQFDKANATLQEIVIQHPDYMFGKLEWAANLMNEGQMEESREVIDFTREMNEVFPEREIFHISEVVTFTLNTIRYYVLNHDFDRAEQYLDRLRLLAYTHFPTSQHIVQLEKMLVIERLKHNMEQLSKSIKEMRKVEATFKIFHGLGEEPPQFQHPEIEVLYKYAFDIPHEEWLAIQAIPHESLLNDLSTVLADSQRRFALYKTKL